MKYVGNTWKEKLIFIADDERNEEGSQTKRAMPNTQTTLGGTPKTGIREQYLEERR